MECDIKIQFLGSNGGEPEHPELYERWEHAIKIPVAGENGLVECMNSLSFTVANRLVEILKSRLHLHIPYYFSIELIYSTASK